MSINKNLKIAIHQLSSIYIHTTSWSFPWIEYCKKNGLNYKIVNCYDSDFINQIKEFDVLLWHFGNYSLQDMLFARSILNTAQNMGLKVFPDFNTAWHFDDKVAEYYLLKSVNAPVPESWVFYNKKDCLQWINKSVQLPVIAKLRTGSGSNNVKLLKSKYSAENYVKRMFGRGFRNVPGVMFKTISNVKSSRNWETFVKRFKRIPDFIQTHTRARKLAREYLYAYFQEFIPNDGYDLKVVVAGEKLCFVARNIRKNDFRASGSGMLHYDKSLITKEIIDTAFEISQKLKFQCMGFDYVVNNKTNKPYIVEISYGFSHTAQLDAGGYFDRNGKWHDEPFNVPEEIIKNLISDI